MGGLVYAFQLVDGVWQYEGTISTQNPQPFDNYGSPVLLDGSTALVGLSGEDTTAGADTGAVDVIRILPGVPESYCTPGTSASGCQATVSAAGTASATAGSGFVVDVQGVEGRSKRDVLLRLERPAGAALGQQHELRVRRSTGQARRDANPATAPWGSATGPSRRTSTRTS